MKKVALSPAEILNFIPQQRPFRFVDEIASVNENQISGTYTFREDEYFYAGHFPSRPLTPGVILLESMCQVGVVAFGIYLLSLENAQTEMNHLLTLFTNAEVEFFKPVYPGEAVIIQAKKIFWRKMKLKSEIQMFDKNRNLLAATLAAGIGVRK